MASKKKIVSSTPTIVELIEKSPTGIIKFKIKNSTRGLWNSLSKSNYVDCLQPILELFDNPFAIRVNASQIRALFDLEKCDGSIEDDGNGFGIDPEELSRCFTWGPDEMRPTDLNEHGCGMKSSLAILDPKDSAWKVCWKHEGSIYCVTAPYSKAGDFEACKIDTWPGTMTGPTGSIVMFPFHKENLRSLYETGNSASFKQVIPKLRQHLSHYWMFLERFVSGKVSLWLNGEEVKPFIMPTQYSEYISKVTNYSSKLPGGANVFMAHYMLNDSIPGSPWFKKAIAYNGLYIFKNGRLIKKVNGGAEYKNILGAVPDNHHNGMIVLVNVTGDPATLPVTVPTKNDFNPNNNPNYDQLIEYIKANIKIPQIEKVSEESLLKQFEKRRTTMFKSAGIDHTFKTKEYIKFSNNTFSSPQLDALEEFPDKLSVYEAKKDNRVSLQTILQMHGNYILAVKALESSKKIVPIILIHCTAEYTMDESLKHTIGQLAKNSSIGFPVEVWNYEAEVLYRFNA